MSLPQFYNPDSQFGLPAPRFHPLARIIVFGLGALAMQVALSLVIVAGLTTAAKVSQQPVAEVARVFFARYALWLSVISYPPLFLWLWFCRGTLDRRSLSALGLRTSNGFGLFGMGVFGGAAAIAFLFGVLWLTRQISVNGTSPEAFDAGAARNIVTLLAYAALFFAVGFMEELMFRGYLLHNLAAFASQRIAIWVQAIAFALVHLGNIGMQAQSNGANADSMRAATFDALRAMPGLVLVGAVFALLYCKTGSLWFPIGFHAGWNFFLGCVFSLPVSGISTFRLLDISAAPNAWLTGGTFGAEGSLLLLPIVAVMWWLLQSQPDHPQARLDLAVLRPDLLDTMLIQTEPQPAVVASIATDDVEDDSEPRQSRFRTSMRSQETDVVSPPIVWGQLPRPETSTPVPMPTEIISASSVAETAAQSTLTEPAPSLAIQNPTQSTLAPTQEPLVPPQTIETPTTSAPAPIVAPKPTAAPTPAATPVSNPDKPTPRKPAPRW